MRALRFFGFTTGLRKFSSRVDFRDVVRITVQAGKGGNGCASISKMPGTKVGIPDGGNGGEGASAFFRATSRNNFNLPTYHFKAQNGENGKRDRCNGKKGATMYIDVPVGTVVKQTMRLVKNNNERVEYTRELGDLKAVGDEIRAATGGRGGYGNAYFRRLKDAKKILFAEQGVPGPKNSFVLELKRIADVGLVGFPNAGKSSLLNVVSRARPKVAAYPFTTLHPMVGVVEVQDRLMSTYTIADIPGLVEGAHENKGLGFEFLRHIERTQVLLYVLDIAGTEQRDPVQDFLTLERELQLYDPTLVKRPSVIFANKIDRKKKTCEKNLARLREMTAIPIIAGSCMKQLGLDELIEQLNFVLAGANENNNSGSEDGSDTR